MRGKAASLLNIGSRPLTPQPDYIASDIFGMRWHHLAPGRGVVEIDLKPTRRPTFAVEKSEPPPPLELELMLWWGAGEPTRAAWLWSQTGEVAAWAAIGEA
jgi:hypothetical protein